jgi:hypothetical protein
VVGIKLSLGALFSELWFGISDASFMQYARACKPFRRGLPFLALD